MIPYLLTIIGGYLIGQSGQSDIQKFADGGGLYVVVKDNKFLTGYDGNYKFTDNKEFAYVFEELKANKMAEMYNGIVKKY